MEKRTKRLQLPENKEFCGKWHHLLAKGRNSYYSKLKMVGGNFQQKPGAGKHRVETQGSQQEMAKSSCHTPR